MFAQLHRETMGLFNCVWHTTADNRNDARYTIPMRMHNPSHPGELLRAYMGRMNVTDLAAHLGVTRVTLSRLLNGNSGISAPMALKLSEAFKTSPELWLNLQTQYDLWQASQAQRKSGRKKVAPIKRSLLQAAA